MNADKIINDSVHDMYWNMDMNCARTAMMTLSKVFGYKIEDQLDHAGIGMHGAGGFGAQCGIVEGTLMFIGCYLKSNCIKDNIIVKFCFDLPDPLKKNSDHWHARF